MGNGISSNLICITRYGNGLEDALGADRDRIAVVAKHVAEYHVFQRLLVIFLCHVESNILYRTELVCVFLVLLELLLAKSARVGTCSIDVVSFLFEFHYCVRGVQSARKGYHYFLLHIYLVFLLSLFDCFSIWCIRFITSCGIFAGRCSSGS